MLSYSIECSPDFEDDLKKLSRKNPVFRNAVDKKVRLIAQNPQAFKPMRSPLQGFRRVHIMKSFVLLYRIKENEKIVVLTKLEHHDSVYM